MSDEAWQDDPRPRIEVCFSPYLYELHSAEYDIVVAIDVLRATTAICAAFDHGVSKIIPVSSVEEARSYQRQGYLAGAERKGEIVKGFDFGNSPIDIQKDEYIGKTLVLTTTNGTRAINLAAKDHTVIVAALSNMTAVAEWLEKQEKNVLCLCSGWQNKFNLEDTICAGGITHHLIESGKFTSIEDSSIAARYIYRQAEENYIGFLKSSSHRRRLRHLNMNEDIKYCLTPDQTEVIPVLVDGELVRMEK